MLQPVRGTRDLLPDQLWRYRSVEKIAKDLAQCYGFEEIEIPMFEFAQVFRHMGETSDVVTKETYTFKDRGDQEITLRPEGTAGVIRAVLSNGLTQSTPLKYYYSGPMFRYERPQKGRYRQFYQFGVELIGVPQTLADIELIALGYQTLQALNLEGGFELELNTLGDTESRLSYRKALVEYLSDFRDQLSEDSQKRLELNPLRVLDSKDKNDIKIIENAPIYREYLNTESEDIFAQILKGLDLLNIPYNLNYRIVRGLDYYCHATYEFVTKALGSQGAIIAGGRYDGLVKHMGGPELAGAGWAAGIDRLAFLANMQHSTARPVTLVPLGQVAEEKAMQMAMELRRKGFYIDIGYGGSLPKRLKKAVKQKARFAILFGDEELNTGQLTIKDLDSGEQSTVNATKLEEFLLEIKE